MDKINSYTTITARIERNAGVIVLNRPQKHNAINTTMMREVVAALNSFDRYDAVRAVVLTGSEVAFSTGADLEEALSVSSPAEYLRYNRSWRALTYAIEHHSMPVIAAISGHCITGGLEVALCCDYRIAADHSRFAITSSKIGSVAGAGGTQRLPRLIGLARAKDMLFTARFVDAAEALHFGLVGQVVPRGDVMAAAFDLVATYAGNAPLSLALCKVAVNTGIDTDLESALDLEASLSAQTFATEDRAEGMSAFLEKRVAIFHGR